MDSEELKNLNNDFNFNKLDDDFNNANSQIERIMKKISNNAILIKNRYLGMIKNKINKSSKEEAVMDISCRCGDSSFSVIVTEKDIERVYAKFDKKCSLCNDFIKIKFIVKEN